MTHQGQIFLGWFLLFCGGILFVTNVLHINLWAIGCPAMLILIGLFMLRPRTDRSLRA